VPLRQKGRSQQDAIARGSKSDLDAGAAKPAADGIGEADIIFRQQHAHDDD